jgi:hypothetical protein
MTWPPLEAIAAPPLLSWGKCHAIKVYQPGGALTDGCRALLEEEGGRCSDD